MGWVMVLMPLTLLVMGVPIFLLLLATCITTVVFFTTLPHVIVHQVVFDSLTKAVVRDAVLLALEGVVERAAASRRGSCAGWPRLSAAFAAACP